MASAGTLISDLDQQQGGGGDGALVDQILRDLNYPTGGQQQAHPQAGRGPPPPPLPQQQPMYQQAPTTAPMTMDSRIPTAHIIGNEHPTPADFTAAMTGMAGARPSEHTLMGAPVGTMPGAYQQPQVYTPPTKNFYSRVIEEVKVPFVVALLFFVFSLPPIRVLVAHYIPSFIKSTGEFTIIGLGAASAVVGTTFWLLNRVIAPLLSL
jgi:hypothetical protein